MNFYTGKKTWDLKSKKLAAFKPSCPEFGYLPFTIPSVSEIDIVSRLKENNTRLHLGLESHEFQRSVKYISRINE